MHNSEFVRNEEKKRFEQTVDGHLTFLDYRIINDHIIINDHMMYLTHTEVPTALGGKGVGKMIVAKTLQYLKDHDLKLVPLCPFVAAYVKRNPEWQMLLAPG